MKCGNLSLRWAPFVFSFVLVLLVLLSTHGTMLLWSQSSEPSLNNSAEHLRTWERLSSVFTLSLEQHEHTLKALGQKLQTSEAGLQQLTPLYELSLQQNERLKMLNEQIAERLQERDEDLAASYDANEQKDKAILKLVIAVILLCAAFFVILVQGRI